MGSPFTKETTTDAKRVVRGEHWLAVRSFLRRRDRVHHARWRLLTLAGGNPSEEISCIRELMPRAEIIAVDTDPACLQAAMSAGADSVLCVDMFAWRSPAEGSRKTILPEKIEQLGRLDAINLDLCGSVTPDVQRGVRHYTRYVVSRGPLMLTFSYGRDVAELFGSESYRGVPSPIGGRVRAVDRVFVDAKRRMRSLHSVLVYKGAAMPMCSLLWLPSTIHEPVTDPHFEQVGEDDLRLACIHPDPERLYAVPSDRIRGWRRQEAARKAVATRQLKAVP